MLNIWRLHLEIRFFHRWLIRAWVGVLGMVLLATAVAKDANKPESQAKAKAFKTRFFPLERGLFPVEKSAGSKEDGFIAPSNRDVSALLKEFGVEFPAGTGATYCELHGILVATHTPEVLEQIEVITGRSCCPLPAQIETELDLVQMTTTTFHELSAQKLSERSVVPPDLLEKLRRLEASGKVVVVDRIHDRSTSGESSEQRHTVEHAHVEDCQVKNSRGMRSRTDWSISTRINWKPV